MPPYPPDTSSPDTSSLEPLRQDIRLLGRILGDTLRQQEGEAIFDLVEQVRQTAVRFARENDPAALEEILQEGNRRAAKTAETTMNEVFDAMKFR